jgi:hypothetical protein
MPDYPVSLTATFTYKVTFKVVVMPGGLTFPGGVTWGVTVNGKRYTTKGYSSIIVPGLSGTVDYSYDLSVPVPWVAGGYYVCLTDCIGSGVSGPTTWTAIYQPQLVVTPVSPPSPPNGGTATNEFVTLEVRVTGPTGAPVSGATVYVNYYPNPFSGTVYTCTPGQTDSQGYFSCSIDTYKFETPSTFTWYANASKAGYAANDSPNWTFTSLTS